MGLAVHHSYSQQPLFQSVEQGAHKFFPIPRSIVSKVVVSPEPSRKQDQPEQLNLGPLMEDRRPMIRGERRQVDSWGRLSEPYVRPSLSILLGLEDVNEETESYWYQQLGEDPDPIKQSYDYNPLIVRGIYANRLDGVFHDLRRCLDALRASDGDHAVHYDRAKMLTDDLERRARYGSGMWDADRYMNPGMKILVLSLQVEWLLDWMDEYDKLSAPHDRRARKEQCAFLLHAYPRRKILAFQKEYTYSYTRYHARMNGVYVHLSSEARDHELGYPFPPCAAYRARFGYVDDRPEPVTFTEIDHVRWIASELRRVSQPFRPSKALITVKHALDMLTYNPCIFRATLADLGYLGEVLAISQVAVRHSSATGLSHDEVGACNKISELCEQILEGKLKISCVPPAYRSARVTFAYSDQSDSTYPSRPPFWEAFENRR